MNNKEDMNWTRERPETEWGWRCEPSGDHGPYVLNHNIRHRAFGATGVRDFCLVFVYVYSSFSPISRYFVLRTSYSLRGLKSTDRYAPR